MGILDLIFGPKTEPSLCEVCLWEARRHRLTTVYVYANGHFLQTRGMPTLSQWPAANKIPTFCGLDIYGMGRSTQYTFDPDEDVSPVTGWR